jgi:hypothetical protein
MKIKTTTVTIDGLDLECHYIFHPKDERVGIMYGYVEILKVVYNCVDVTKLIDTIDVNFFVKLEEQIMEEN